MHEGISVWIVSHNGREKLPRSLGAVLDVFPPERVTVLDVASSDGTGAMLAYARPSVEVIRLTENRGPNPARNLALEFCTTPFALLMDDDVEVSRSAVDALRRAMESDPDLAVAAPIVVYGDRPDTVQYSCGPLHYLIEAIDPRQGGPLADLSPGDREVVVMSGCALLIRREAMPDALRFDERYFFGRTDGDFAYRLAVAGLKAVVVRNAVVRHHSGPRGTKAYAHQLANSWHMALKCYQASTLLVIAPMLVLHGLTQLAAVAKAGQLGAVGRALAMLVRRLPALRADRAAVAALRRRPDVELLSGDPFVVPPGMRGRLADAYQRLAGRYWRVVRVLLVGSRSTEQAIRRLA